MKIVYLVTACAYCLQFIANYLTVLTEVTLGKAGVDFVTMSPWGIWAIYACWLSLVSGIAFYFYQKQNSHEQLIRQAYVLFYCVIVSVAIMIFLLFICFSERFKNFLYREVCYN